jgi:hypothetical protein
MSSIYNADLLNKTLEYVENYLSKINTRSVFPRQEDLQAMAGLDVHIPDHPVEPQRVIELIHSLGSPATVATNGGRYFGFVIGGTLPVALSANMLAAAWDQCAGLHVLSPVA